ncbi:MAG TPA: glutaredoxin domain-containing protein [Chthoniobacterales bacterium]|nr:glutaredoxin domain-containing protein [Chthoniobacterales bacterium]
MKLYVKAGCPWCMVAEQYLNNRGYKYESVEIRRNRAAYDELVAVSGQTSAPTPVTGELVLSDFGPDELEDFLKEHNIRP